MDVTQYAPGVYWLTLKMADKVAIKKFVKIP
jgi:hypothetical protein